MRAWAPILALGILAVAAGGALVLLHTHHTVGLGGIGVGALLVLVGVGAKLLGRKNGPVQGSKVTRPPVQRGAYRKAAIAVIVVVVIGVGTYYGTSYLAGTQPGAAQSASLQTRTGQTTLESGNSSVAYSFTTVSTDTYYTYIPSTVTSSSSNTFTSGSATSSSATTTSAVTGSLTTGSTTSISTESTGSLYTGSFSTGSASTSLQSSSSTTTESATIPTSCVTSEALDGEAMEYTASGDSGSVTLTTHASPDIIVVFTSAITTPEGSGTAPSGVMGISDGTSSLSFHLRTSYTTHDLDSGKNFLSEEEWYAVSSAPLSADPITVTLSGSSYVLGIIAFAVSGINPTSPFDPNASVPVAVTGSNSGPIFAPVSTTCPDDIIIGGAVMISPDTTVGGGFTLIGSDEAHSLAQDQVAEYQAVSSPQSNLAVGFNAQASPPSPRWWIVIGDALN
ncbi:MAG: hypothetical protein ABSF83_09635 [Nitrososphaerales archaeon]|jgi:hypothetical protein